MNPCFETATRLARAIRNGRLSSVEATKVHLERIARLNGPINALVVVDRDGALKAARAADRATGKEEARLGPAARRAHHHQGGVRRRGACTPPRAIRRSRTMSPRTDASLVGPPARGRRGDPGQDQCARTVRRLSDRQPAVRHHQERLGSAAHGRRLDRRRRGRGRGAPVAARARQRHRRLGAQSRALQRHLFAEAHRVARAGPRPCARTCPARRGPAATWACSARWRARSRISRRRCASSPGPTATRPRLRRCRSGLRPRCKAKDLRIAVHREQSAGQGVGRHRVRRAATVRLLTKAGAKVKRAEPEGLDWRQGWDDWCRSLPLPGPRPAAARRARAHFRAWSSRPIRRRARAARTARLDMARVLRRARPARPASCGSANPSSTTTTPG